MCRWIKVGHSFMFALPALRMSSQSLCSFHANNSLMYSPDFKYLCKMELYTFLILIPRFTSFIIQPFPPDTTQPIVGVYFTALYRALASSRTRLFDHTQRLATVGRTPLNEWSVRCRDLYLTTHNTHNRQTSMPRVGFQPMIAAG